MNKKVKQSIIGSILSFLIISCAFSISMSVAYFKYSERFTVNVETAPYLDENGTNLMCYPISKVDGTTTNQDYVAVGWGLKPAEGTSTITIPKTVKHTVEEVDPETGNTVNVVKNPIIKAIVKSGFRYCAFTSISFDASSEVEEIQAEAFYSCQNITSFTLPKMCVYGVGSSAFMDCRNLETFSTTNVSDYIVQQITSWDSITTEAQQTWIQNHRFCIGDHAFSSCVKLTNFDFPRNLKDIGESAFQKCTSFTSIFLPKRILFKTNIGEQNETQTTIFADITIGKYAFADCSKLSIMHLCRNISFIDSYAFAKCESLKIYYEGGNPNAATDDPTYDANDPLKDFDSVFRKKHVATNQTNTFKDYVPIEFKVSEMSVDNNHPDFIYIQTDGGTIYYDGDGTDDKSSTKKLYPSNNSTSTFITIFKFWPAASSTDFVNGVLTIPATINGYPVRRIAKQAFYDNSRRIEVPDPTEENPDNTKLEDPLKKVIFNADLIQIESEAFKDCYNLEELDFTLSTNLIEIGHSAFEVTSAAGGKNAVFDGTLDIPRGVKYIGNYAFKNFTKATGLSFYTTTPALNIIGRQAFYNFGSEVANNKKGTVDLVLPSTLNQKSVTSMLPDPKPAAKGSNASIGDSAFANCPLLKTVSMQYHDTKPSKADQRTSFGAQVFSGCSELLSFKGNYAFGYIGSASFEQCPKLKEIFFSTHLNNTASFQVDNAFTWCYDDEGGSLFFSGNDFEDNACEFRDLVIYVDGGQDPQRKDRQDKYYTWNSDPKTYQDEYATSGATNAAAPYKNNGGKDSDFRTDNVIGRPVITTYFGIDYHTAGTIKYLDYSSGSPSNTPDYSSSVACVIPKDGTNYTVTRCYATGKTSIDMSGWEPASGKTIDTIGPSAFATRVAGNTTSKIILPTTITTIRERAFYSVGTDGIDCVTYLDANDDEVEDNDYDNICFLPSSVTRLERMAFFNNDFQKIELSGNLTFMGNTAFAISRTKTATIESFIVGTGTSTDFDYIGNGMYDSATKTLLYYAASGTGQLDLSAVTLNSTAYNVKAVGARALARSKYTSVKLPTSLTTIYGGAFENSSITSVTFDGDPGLKYIAAAPAYNESDSTVWYDFNQHFDMSDIAAKDAGNDVPSTYSLLEPMIDISTSGHNPHVDNNTYNFANRTFYFNWYAKYGAFANCTSLSTFNFIALKDTLRKIGYGAFEGCTSLSNMTNGDDYIYVNYQSGLTIDDDIEDMIDNETITPTIKEDGVNVLDLGPLTNLTSIGRAAFKGCSSIHYVHLPLVYAEDVDQDTQAKLYLDLDYEDRGSWYARQASTNESIFAGTGVASNGAILVGETANYAKNTGLRYDNSLRNINSGIKNNRDNNKNTNNMVNNWDTTLYNTSRYPSYIFNSTDFNPSVYYFISGYSAAKFNTSANNGNNAAKNTVEVITGTDTSTKYWTFYGDPTDHIYVLFENINQLKAYFKV